ncbi:MAG TPA: hypothetical protein PJ993_02215 [Candidatus Saccharibacteria bacterium]|nr:hypothetical protein [Candidatus Saccharibacteria bacterium]HMT39724.1 hypothetical protein [Candidatus Saccharibacteria bacterium]
MGRNDNTEPPQGLLTFLLWLLLAVFASLIIIFSKTIALIIYYIVMAFIWTISAIFSAFFGGSN